MSRCCFLTVLLSGAIGCGNNASTPDDAVDASILIDSPMSSPCWLDAHTPGGTVQLGTGTFQYTPMADHVALEFGTQLGFDIPVHAEMTGLLPGNPKDTLDPSNPRTRFHGFFVDTGESINPGRCGMRLAYVPAAGSAYDLLRGSAILFDVTLTEADLFGREVRVVVEVIDSNANYAMDEKIVICDPPPGWPMN